MLVSPSWVYERKPKENQHVRHFSSARTLQPDEPQFFGCPHPEQNQGREKPRHAAITPSAW
jgi:hypothetical protein